MKHGIVAITIKLAKIHPGCTREEHMQLFLKIWNKAECPGEEQAIDVKAVTA